MQSTQVKPLCSHRRSTFCQLGKSSHLGLIYNPSSNISETLGTMFWIYTPLDQSSFVENRSPLKVDPFEQKDPARQPRHRRPSLYIIPNWPQTDPKQTSKSLVQNGSPFKVDLKNNDSAATLVERSVYVYDFQSCCLGSNKNARRPLESQLWRPKNPPALQIQNTSKRLQ